MLGQPIASMRVGERMSPCNIDGGLRPRGGRVHLWGGGGDASRDRETVGQESEEAKKRSSVSGHASVSARYRDNLSAGVVGKGARDGERRVAAWELEQGLPFDDHKSSCGDGGKGGGGKSGGGRSMHERLTLSCISKITPRRPYVTSPPPGHLEIGHLQ